MFLHCPPWRKPRPASPSDVARSYQGSQIRDVQAPRQHAQEPRHESEHSPSPHSKYHLESISRIIRRRFSRESRSSSAQHESGKFLFPFPRKSSRSASKPNTELAALGAYGSSLMSESRYDSDAQFISTPRRDLMDSPANRARRRMELSDLIERSQEHREAERWAIGYGDNIPEPPESAFGLHFIQTPSGTMRSHRSPYLNGHHSVSVEGQQKHSVNSARSLPDLNSARQRHNRSVAGSCSAVQYIQAGNDQKHLTDCQSMDMSGHKHGVTCSDPSSNQPLDLIVPKRRQPIDSGVFLTDSQTVHLEAMGISHRLASNSASSVPESCNPSIAELIRSNRYGVFMNASQENMSMPQRSTTSFMSGHNPKAPTCHNRDASSYYSRQPSPLSANASPRSHSLALDSEQQVGKVHGSKHNLAAEVQNNSAFTIPTVGSRFREHCDNEVPPNSQAHIESNEVHGGGAPRKVSVGWMSGGRRVGYGYSPVPDDEAAQYQQHGDAHPNLQQVPDQKAETRMNDINVQGGHARQNHVQRTDLVHAAGPTTPQSQCLSTNYHATHPETGPATLPRVSKSNQTKNDYPEPPFLRDILAGRYSQEHERGPVVSEKQSMTSLHAAKMPVATQSEHCQVSQSSNYTSQQSDTALHQRAGLSQSMKSNPQSSKHRRGRRAGISDLSRRDKRQHNPITGDNAVDIDPDYLGIEHDFDAEDVARLLRPSNPRGANWVRRLSKHKVSKRFSNAQQKEQSQTSLSLYQNRNSNSLERADSTKSIGTNAEELASMYQECLDMPGSFEGSRWASRTSRMLWDLVTTDDR